MPSKHYFSSRCSSAGRVTASLLLSFVALSSLVTALNSDSVALSSGGDLSQLPAILPVYRGAGDDKSPESAERFSLRHLFHHGTYLYPTLHRRKDILNSEAKVYSILENGDKQEIPPLMVRSQSIQMQRLADRRPCVIDPMLAAAREHGEVWTLSPSAWTIDDIPAPNMTDKETVVSLAEMAAAAYVEDPNTSGWENINNGFTNSTDFGWEGDGLRGHVWANPDNSTIVISLKGTSVAVFDGTETTTADKENDNLFFSCCCGQQGQLTWRKVCDCATSTYTCNNTCVAKSLRKENRYYQAARELYTNVTALYPDSNVWVSGHSLGGAVSSLLGMTYGLPAITFEAPPDNLAAKRLGLPSPPVLGSNIAQRRGHTGVWHVGHTADPIYLGSCNGVTSPCSFAGYAMESACHTGSECVYDVVADKGWRVGLTTHSIRGVIDNILKKYDTVPVCAATPECVDCPLWKFYESNSSESTTSSSSSSTTSRTRTRTETCKTPGWWGCLDETSTSGATTTSSVTTTTSSATCLTPGWFGCKDGTTATTISTVPVPPISTKTASKTCQSPGYFGRCNDIITPTTSSEPTPTPTCHTPGYFGCKDKPTEPPITSPPSKPTPTSEPDTTTTTCTSKEWFGFICVDPSPTSSNEPKASPKPSQHCAQRSWLGYCKEWVEDKKSEISEEL